MRLEEFGLDSLMGLEIRLVLDKKYGIVLSPQEIRDLTFRKLQHSILSKKRKEDEKEETYFLLPEMLSTLFPKALVEKMNDVEEGPPLFMIHHLFGAYLF